MRQITNPLSPLRVCIIGSYPPVRGGEASYVNNFVRAMSTYLPGEIGEIFVLSHSESAIMNRYEKKGKTQVLRLFNSRNLFGRNFSFLKIISKLWSIRPDIVHVQYSAIPGGRYGGLLGESLFIVFALLKILKIPFFITQHNVWMPDQARNRLQEKTGSWFLARFGAWYFRGFMHLMGISPTKLFLLVHVKNSLVTRQFSKAYRIPDLKVVEETHGAWVNLDRINEQDHKSSRRIVSLGILNPSKGYEFLILAMRDILKVIPEATLVIAGSPPTTNQEEGKEYINRLRAIIQDNRLADAVTIEDRYLSDAEFVDYIKSAGIVALPYSNVGGASGIMHLAMEYGTPLILAGSGTLFKEISQYVPVVPPMNSSRMAESIISVFKDVNYCASIRENYKQYLKDHDWRLVAQQIYETYKKSLEPSRLFMNRTINVDS